MREQRGRYAHRGAVERRANRLKRQIVGVSACAVLLIVYQSNRPAEAAAPAAPGPEEIARKLERELSRTRGELEVANEQLERWHRIFKYSARYDISAALATSIHDVAIAEGIEPELAFRLVRLESRFNPRATSPVGAIGLAQVMLPTARFFDRDITGEGLYDPETNLRIGFRYLRTLIDEYDGDVRLALLTYNRGPAAVQLALRNGEDPSNGYDRILMRDYSGSGVVPRRSSSSAD